MENGVKHNKNPAIPLSKGELGHFFSSRTRLTVVWDYRNALTGLLYRRRLRVASIAVQTVRGLQIHIVRVRDTHRTEHLRHTESYRHPSSNGLSATAIVEKACLGAYARLLFKLIAVERRMTSLNSDRVLWLVMSHWRCLALPPGVYVD